MEHFETFWNILEHFGNCLAELKKGGRKEERKERRGKGEERMKKGKKERGKEEKKEGRKGDVRTVEPRSNGFQGTNNL